MSAAFETPAERWDCDPRGLQHVTEARLLNAFVLFFERTASNDRVVSIDQVDYELPAALGPRGRRQGAKVQLVHRLLDDTYHAVCGDLLVRLHPVDLAANARAPRARSRRDDEPPTSPPAKTAADLAFERDYAPVTDEDGGVPEPPPHDDPQEETPT